MILTAQFSMKTFMELVGAGNWHFTLKKSSLEPLINELGGEYDKTKLADVRTLSRAKLELVQGVIWPEGDGVNDSPWGLKKKKYQRALGYLAKTLYLLDEADALLVGSYKSRWVQRSLTHNMKFVSGSGVKEAELATSGGLKKRFASELCIPVGGMIGDWDVGHKFVFGKVMKTEADGSLTSAGAIGKQGFGSNVYCFERRALTEYFCMFDVENTPKYVGEVAFPDDVAISYIKPYPGGRPKPANAMVWQASDWT